VFIEGVSVDCVYVSVCRRLSLFMPSVQVHVGLFPCTHRHSYHITFAWMCVYRLSSIQYIYLLLLYTES